MTFYRNSFCLRSISSFRSISFSHSAVSAAYAASSLSTRKIWKQMYARAKNVSHAKVLTVPPEGASAADIKPTKMPWRSSKNELMSFSDEDVKDSGTIYTHKQRGLLVPATTFRGKQSRKQRVSVCSNESMNCVNYLLQ